MKWCDWCDRCGARLRSRDLNNAGKGWSALCPPCWRDIQRVDALEELQAKWNREHPDGE